MRDVVLFSVRFCTGFGDYYYECIPAKILGTPGPASAYKEDFKNFPLWMSDFSAYDVGLFSVKPGENVVLLCVENSGYQQAIVHKLWKTFACLYNKT
jgi:hypothetical protein